MARSTSRRFYLLRPVSPLQLDIERANLTIIRKFTWDVRRSTVTVKEGKNRLAWSQNVGALPPNVQDIIASGGLEKWVKKRIRESRKVVEAIYHPVQFDLSVQSGDWIRRA